MELSKDIIKMLEEKHNVYYNKQKEAWVRMQGDWVNFELGIITKIITGENILIKGESFVDFTQHEESGNICICGCPHCNTLYRLYHKKTGTCFLVGSVCIKKAGHVNFINDLNCGKRNGYCCKCKKPLILRGLRKNTNKELKNICLSCC